MRLGVLDQVGGFSFCSDLLDTLGRAAKKEMLLPPEGVAPMPGRANRKGTLVTTTYHRALSEGAWNLLCPAA